MPINRRWLFPQGLTGFSGGDFGRGVTRGSGAQRVGGDDPELILRPGRQIDHGGHFCISLHIHCS